MSGFTSVDVALGLLRGGAKGIEEWNRLRAANNNPPSLQGADLSGLNMTGVNLCGVQLLHVTLTDAVLLDAQVDRDTMLRNCKVQGLAIDRFTLECLGENSGVTRGDIMRMRVRDDVAKLRRSYSGFMQWVHLTALAVFLFPYLWFVVKQWNLARFRTTDDKGTISLAEALGRFIVSGGDGWRSGWVWRWSFVLFVFALIYNGLRGALLWKTKQLEEQQQATGLPAMFSLKSTWWGHAEWFARWGFYAHLMAVLANTAHFLSQRIPL